MAAFRLILVTFFVLFVGSAAGQAANADFVPAALDPTAGPAGSSSQLTVQSLVPYDIYDVLWENSTSNWPLVGEGRADATGQLTLVVTIPSGAQPGVYVLDVLHLSTPYAVAQLTYTVTNSVGKLPHVQNQIDDLINSDFTQ
jgi:hypothetical protein